MSLQVTIPLEEYLRLMIRNNQYTIIDQLDKSYIESSGDYTGLCVIENSPDAVDFYNNPLPTPKANNWRLWYKKDWELNGNRHRATLAKFKAIEDERQRKIDAIVNHFASVGITKEIATTIIKGMSTDVIETTYKTIQQPTTTQQ